MLWNSYGGLQINDGFTIISFAFDAAFENATLSCLDKSLYFISNPFRHCKVQKAYS